MDLSFSISSDVSVLGFIAVQGTCGADSPEASAFGTQEPAGQDPPTPKERVEATRLGQKKLNGIEGAGDHMSLRVTPVPAPLGSWSKILNNEYQLKELLL